MAQVQKRARSASFLFFLWMAVLVLALCGMMLILNRVYMHSMNEESRDVATAGLRSVTENIETWSKQATHMLRSMSYNTQVQQLMAAADYIEWYRRNELLDETYSLNMLMDENIVNLIYLDRLHHIVSYAGNVLYQKEKLIQWYQETLPGKDPVFSLYQAYIAMPDHRGEVTLMACLPTYATKLHLGVKLLDPLGAVYLQVDLQKLLRRAMAGMLLEGTEYHFVCPEYGHIAGSSNLESIVLDALEAQGYNLKDWRLEAGDRTYAVSASTPEGMPFTVVQVRRDESAQLMTNRLYRYELGMLAVILALLLLTGLALYRGIMRPLNQLTRHIGRMRERGEPLDVRLSGVSEMQKIEDEFNALTQERERFRHHLLLAQQDVHEKELQRKHYQALSMVSQINPHFLSNTLEIIRAMALEGRAGELADLMRDVSRIYRYTISSPDTVRLEDELKMLSAYLNIQTVRFGERFTYTIHASEEVRAQMIPKMVLQPIVENAILHGLELREREGHLSVDCALSEDELLLTVEDDGRGIDEETRAAIKSQLESPGEWAAHDNLEKWSIGIWNVHTRIRGQYGDGCGVFLEEKESPGARFVLRIKRGGA